jgi:hypothetical protein
MRIIIICLMLLTVGCSETQQISLSIKDQNGNKIDAASVYLDNKFYTKSNKVGLAKIDIVCDKRKHVIFVRKLDAQTYYSPYYGTFDSSVCRDRKFVAKLYKKKEKLNLSKKTIQVKSKKVFAVKESEKTLASGDISPVTFPKLKASVHDKKQENLASFNATNLFEDTKGEQSLEIMNFFPQYQQFLPATIKDNHELSVKLQILSRNKSLKEAFIYELSSRYVNTQPVCKSNYLGLCHASLHKSASFIVVKDGFISKKLAYRDIVDNKIYLKKGRSINIFSYSYNGISKIPLPGTQIYLANRYIGTTNRFGMFSKNIKKSSDTLMSLRLVGKSKTESYTHNAELAEGLTILQPFFFEKSKKAKFILINKYLDRSFRKSDKKTINKKLYKVFKKIYKEKFLFVANEITNHKKCRNVCGKVKNFISKQGSSLEIISAFEDAEKKVFFATVKNLVKELDQTNIRRSPFMRHVGVDSNGKLLLTSTFPNNISAQIYGTLLSQRGNLRKGAYVGGVELSNYIDKNKSLKVSLQNKPAFIRKHVFVRESPSNNATNNKKIITALDSKSKKPLQNTLIFFANKLVAITNLKGQAYIDKNSPQLSVFKEEYFRKNILLSSLSTGSFYLQKRQIKKHSFVKAAKPVNRVNNVCRKTYSLLRVSLEQANLEKAESLLSGMEHNQMFILCNFDSLRLFTSLYRAYSLEHKNKNLSIVNYRKVLENLAKFKTPYSVRDRKYLDFVKIFAFSRLGAKGIVFPKMSYVF